MRFWLWYIFTLCIYNCCYTSRILAVFPVAVKSHYAPFRKILLELSKRGHEVVCISPYEEKDAPINFKWIQVETSSFKDIVPESIKEMKEKKTFFGQQTRLWRFMNIYTERVSKLPKFKKFIEEDRSKFDLVIAEEFFTPLFYIFAHKYNAPLVLASSFGSAHYISEYLGNSLELSYVPHEFSHMYKDFTIWERFQNVIFSYYHIIFRKFYSVDKQNDLAKDIFSDIKDLPKVESLEKEAAVMLLNSHYSMSIVRPLLPNMIEIGGIHIDDPKPLPKDLRKILDEADNGVIIFSLGSYLEPSQLPTDKITNILKAFEGISQRVIMKWDTNVELPVKLPNVFPRTWLPQNDVLAHKNTIGLITHGGLLSAQEAVHHGIPVICLPFYGDQWLNCRRSVQLGYGMEQSFLEMTTESFRKSINNLISNKNYKATAEELSKRFRVRQNRPLETAIFWIEYVISHKGADFIKSPKRNHSWYQIFMVDIIILIVLVLWVLRTIIRKLIYTFSSNKINKKIKTK